LFDDVAAAHLRRIAQPFLHHDAAPDLVLQVADKVLVPFQEGVARIR